MALVNLVVLVLSALIVLCGLYALLTQKTYLDAGNGKETTIKITGWEVFGAIILRLPSWFLAFPSRFGSYICHIVMRKKLLTLILMPRQTGF